MKLIARFFTISLILLFLSPSLSYAWWWTSNVTPTPTLVQIQEDVLGLQQEMPTKAFQSELNEVQLLITSLESQITTLANQELLNTLQEQVDILQSRIGLVEERDTSSSSLDNILPSVKLTRGVYPTFLDNIEGYVTFKNQKPVFHYREDFSPFILGTDGRIETSFVPYYYYLQPDCEGEFYINYSPLSFPFNFLPPQGVLFDISGTLYFYTKNDTPVIIFKNRVLSYKHVPSNECNNISSTSSIGSDVNGMLLKSNIPSQTGITNYPFNHITIEGIYNADSITP